MSFQQATRRASRTSTLDASDEESTSAGLGAALMQAYPRLWDSISEAPRLSQSVPPPSEREPCGSRRGAVVDGSSRRGAVVDGSSRRGTVVAGSSRRGTVVAGSSRRGAVVDGSSRRGTVVAGSSRRGAVVDCSSRRVARLLAEVDEVLYS